MTRHLELCNRYKTKIRSDVNGQHQMNFKSMSNFFSRSTADSTSTEPFTVKDILEKIVNYFISANHAFNTADNSHFRELMNLISVSGPPLKANRFNVTNRFHELVKQAKDDLMIRLRENDSKISLALNA